MSRLPLSSSLLLVRWMDQWQWRTAGGEGPPASPVAADEGCAGPDLLSLPLHLSLVRLAEHASVISAVASASASSCPQTLTTGRSSERRQLS